MAKYLIDFYDDEYLEWASERRKYDRDFAEDYPEEFVNSIDEFIKKKESEYKEIKIINSEIEERGKDYKVTLQFDCRYVPNEMCVLKYIEEGGE